MVQRGNIFYVHQKEGNVNKKQTKYVFIFTRKNTYEYISISF